MVKTLYAACLWAGAVLGAASAAAGTTAEDLLARYEAIQSLSCEIRRDTESESRMARSLSRVYYERPDRLHVENVAPLRRRIVADGRRLYFRMEDDRRAFRQPIAELDERALIELRRVPGTAADRLMRLRGVPEDVLEPTDRYPVRRGYRSEKVYVVLSLDSEGRLARLELFDAPDMASLRARVDYGAFAEGPAGVSIPCVHRAVYRLGGREITETTRVVHLKVNEPIEASLFDASRYFGDVEFVDGAPGPE